MTREEAIRRIKAWNLDSDDMEVLSVVIPELAESEDERIRKELVNFILYRAGRVLLDKETEHRFVAYLEKQKEQKPEWSDEDRDNLERVDNYLWILDNYIGDDCATPQGKADKIRGNIQEILSPWLKSLPERFNPQPKQEWSEEDINKIRSEEYTKGFNDAAFGGKLKEWSKEDETMINHIIEALPKWANGLITILPSQAEEYVKRLKSLRSQYLNITEM